MASKTTSYTHEINDFGVVKGERHTASWWQPPYRPNAASSARSEAHTAIVDWPDRDKPQRIGSVDLAFLKGKVIRAGGQL
jgi:hypothetical protein